MSRRRVAALLLATVALAGCGEKPEPDLSQPAAVTGTVDLDRAAPAVPVAGTTSGHKAAADGRFFAQLRKLSRGRHRYVLHGTSPGLRPWTVAISITRK
jgi:ABC-type Fe2+-enterobactin transport system substrate-binding protein